MTIDTQIKNLKDFYESNETESYQFRYNALLKLKHILKTYESEINHALKQDLNKPEFEIYASELSLIYNEIDYTLKHLKKWLRVKKVPNPLALFYAKSYIIQESLGLVLIISPWNYPLQLALIPLIGAVAAGNVAVIKPSEYTPHINRVLNEIISKSFLDKHVIVIEGDGATIISQLINTNLFEHVFFTGSTRVGKVVANLCSDKLIPYTLELGGKNPAIINANCDLEVCAKRIVWAKFFNAGQTCIAPDYLLVESAIKSEFIKLLQKYILQFYPKLDDYAKIINKTRFEHLINLLADLNIIHGGKYNIEQLFIEPTLVLVDNLNTPIMQEEIFGPILPIISYQQENDIYNIILRNPYPLALYVFSNDKYFNSRIISKIKFGGGGINTALLHFANYHLPFGGIRYSGIGKYHAKYTFDVFSHNKSIVDMSTKIDINIKYPLYTNFKLKLLELFS